MKEKKRFSRDFATFEEWSASTPASAAYRERVRMAVLRHPGISLNQARGHAGPREKPLEKMPTTPISHLPIESRTPREEQNLRKGRSVYWAMRNEGISLEEAANRYRISPETVLRTLGAFVKCKGRWQPKKSFSSPIQMRVVAEGEDRILIISSSEDASLIGKHHNAIKMATQTGDEKFLNPFRGKKIRDELGHLWELETNLETLYAIQERREDEELYSIYKE